MSDYTTELNDENFDGKTKKGKWIIDFFADWCGPCRIIAPTMEELGKELKGKIHFGKVDVDANQDLAQRFEVMSIPTIIFIKDGEIVNRFVGVREKEEIESMAEESF